jgi:hypothetical protein
MGFVERKLNPGDAVMLTQVPPGLLDKLPLEDQKAIIEIVGQPVRLNGYDEDGRAELEFTDSVGVIHFIYVSPVFVKSVI